MIFGLGELRFGCLPKGIIEAVVAGWGGGVRVGLVPEVARLHATATSSWRRRAVPLEERKLAKLVEILEESAEGLGEPRLKQQLSLLHEVA